MNFTVSVDHRVKIKENENGDANLNLARELKNLCTWDDSKRLGKMSGKLEIGGRAETILIKALLKSARIRRRVLETCGDLLSLRTVMWKTRKEYNYIFGLFRFRFVSFNGI